MKNLRKSSLVFAALLLTSSCANSRYRIVTNERNKREIEVSSDRILLECEDVEAEGLEAYGFFIHVLDDANTVLSVWQTNKIDKESCLANLKRVASILKKDSTVRIFGIGDLREPRKKNGRIYNFKGRGEFPGNDLSYSLVYIKNSKGGCFDVYAQTEKLCPQSDIDFN